MSGADEGPSAAHVRADAADARERSPAPAAPASVGHPILVVVAPFETNTPAAEPESFRDEVVAGLSRFRELQVFAETRDHAQLVARTTGGRDAGYVLRASLRIDGAGAKLVAQLSRGGSGRIVWSEAFAARPSWSPADRDRVIARIVGAVLPTIAEDRLGNPAENPEHRGYERVILTRGPDLKPRTFAEARAAADSLETMIAANPAFPMPYFPLAYLYNTDFGYTRAGSSGPEERARAMQLSRTALALDRSHVHGYTVTGWCHLRRREFAAARTFFDQALALNPFHARRVMEVGWGYLFLGELEAAEAMFDRCLLLFPSPADGFFMDLGLLALLRGEHDKADGYFDITADPEIWTPIYRAINAVLAGRPDRDKTATAHARIAAIWPPDRPLTGEGVTAWFQDHHPFRSPHTGAALFAGAEQLFRTIG